MKSFSKFISEATVSRAVVQGKALGMTNIGPDGRSHGDWYKVYPDGTKEFTAKTSGKGLVFYNQNQVPGRKDPTQVRTPANQQPVATQTNVIRKENLNNFWGKDLRENYIAGKIFNDGEFVESISTGKIGQIIRRGTNYLICVTENGEMFKSWIHDLIESDIEIPSTNLKKLVKKAVNRKDENIDGFVDKEDPKVGPYGAFIPQARNVPKNFGERYQEKSVDSETRVSGKPNTLIGTNGYRKYAMKMMGMDKILNFNIDGKNFINKYRKK